ncbi:hypothetical protein C0J52_20301 [Blattella germanica]|nr:hypothetical protein C0J52_20301 [Blattella germanica]
MIFAYDHQGIIMTDRVPCGRSVTGAYYLNMNKNGALDGIIKLPRHWDSVIQKQGDYIEGL